MTGGGFDVVGDIHGHAAKLVALLERMGYSETDGVWSHPSRSAIFVGDLVDRGPEQVETVRIVRAMVEAGAAQIVAGNHEFNAVAWQMGLRPQSKRGQHEVFLDQVVEGSEAHIDMLEWFLTIPLWLDLGDLRVVHACWDPHSMIALEGKTGPNNTLTRELVAAACVEGSDEHAAIENLLKGPEVPLDGYPKYRVGGADRSRARWRWWSKDAVSLLRGAKMPIPLEQANGDPYPPLSDDPLENLPVDPYTDAVPVLFGHYWETGTPAPLAERAACLDYSAGRNGPLVAYRWDGESVLDASKFISSH